MKRETDWSLVNTHLLEALLVDVMSDEPDGATKHKQAVQDADIKVLGGLLWIGGVRMSRQTRLLVESNLGCECTGLAEEIDKRSGDNTIHIENQVGPLGRRELLDLGSWNNRLNEEKKKTSFGNRQETNLECEVNQWSRGEMLFGKGLRCMRYVGFNGARAGSAKSKDSIG